MNAGQLDAARTLLRAGVNPNLKDIQGDTALHMAAASGDFHIAEELLLQPGLHVNATNMQQRTALHAALMAGHEQTGELLMAAGCDSTMMDVFEKNAYDYLDEYQRNLRELEGSDWPSSEHEASKVHFSSENGMIQNAEDSDAITEISNAQENASMIEADDVEQFQDNSIPFSEEGQNLEKNTSALLENGDVSTHDLDTVLSEYQTVSIPNEYNEDIKDEGEMYENGELQDFEEDNHHASPSEERTHKKASAKSRGRHRKTSKSSSKGGHSSPRHSKSGKSGRAARVAAAGDGGGILGMALAGHNHEHQEQSPPRTVGAKAGHPHQQSHHHSETSNNSSGEGSRIRKLGVASMK